MNRQQQMQDILKETVDYYRKDPENRRSISDDGNCMYTWGNNHCAVGRYLKPEYQKENWVNNNDSVNELCEHNDNLGGFDIDWCLIDKVHGLDADFWDNLQDIHDRMSYWEEWDEDNDGKTMKYGLSEVGKVAYVQLQDKITKGDFNG